MANFLESPQEFNKLNKSIGNIYSKYAMYNDNRDEKLYGIPRVGGSVFKSPKDIDMYIKSITEGTKPMSGSAKYSKPKKEKVLVPVKEKSIGGRVPKGTTPPQLKAWLSHVSSVKLKNPNMKYKDILALAKQTYKK